MSTTPETPKPIPPAKVRFNKAERCQEHGNYPLPHLKDPPRIVCSECEEALPFTQFDEATDTLCSECRRNAASKELARLKTVMFEQANSEIVKAANTATFESALNRVGRVFNKFIECMGGEDAFAFMWADQFKIAIKNRPGSHGLLQLCNAIQKIGLEVSKREQQESIIDMSDKELKQRQRMAQFQVLSQVISDPSKAKMLMQVLRASGHDISEEAPSLPEPEEGASHADGD